MAVELPYTITWTSTVTADGTGRYLVAWTITDASSAVVGHFEKIYQATDPELLASRDMRSSAEQIRFANVQVQHLPASGSFTLNVTDQPWPSPFL